MLNERMSRIILGVENNAGYERIKHAYKILLRKYHPDTAVIPNRYLLEKVIQAYNFLQGNKDDRTVISGKKTEARRENTQYKPGKKHDFSRDRENPKENKTGTILKDFDSIFINGAMPWDKIKAVNRLAGTGKKSSYFYLRQALHDKDKRVVHASVKAIGQLKIIQAANEFSAIFRNSDADTRSEILSAVNEIGLFRPFDDIIEAGLYDRDLKIRMQTISIYKNMLLKRNEK